MIARNVLRLASAIACLAAPTAWAQPVAANVHSFVNPLGGLAPGLIVGHETDGTASTWALYGTTQRGGTPSACNGQGCGVVFKLSPPLSGTTEWSAARIYVFKNGIDGLMPSGPVTFDASGAAYGSTFEGGASQEGTLFRLTPPEPGQYFWNKKDLYVFNGSTNCVEPRGPLLLDSAGAIYGVGYATSVGGACIFKLTPPSPGQTAWSISTIYSSAFNAPNPLTLALGRAGALYGTTPDAAVFKLSPPVAPSSAWTFTVLYDFSTEGYSRAVPTELTGVELQADGSLIGASGDGGTASVGTAWRPPQAG